MQTEAAVKDSVEELDFAALLEESLAESRVERGDIVSGTVLSIDSQGLIRRHWMEAGWHCNARRYRTHGHAHCMTSQVDAEIDVAVVNLNDSEGNLILSAAPGAPKRRLETRRRTHEHGSALDWRNRRYQQRRRDRELWPLAWFRAGQPRSRSARAASKKRNAWLICRRSWVTRSQSK